MSSSKDLGVFREKLVVFGGAYSNLQATKAMLETVSKLGVPSERVICNGDIVAYCSQPEETVKLIIESDMHCIQGNCEESLAADLDDCGCGFEEGSACDLLSAQWYNFSKDRVSEQSKSWMRALPFQISFVMNNIRFVIVHGSVSNINQFVFQSDSKAEKERQLDLAKADVVIGGHCGIPFAQQLNSGWWLNSGVIGMPPNDGQAHTWYLTLTPDENGVRAEWHPLCYEHELAARHMEEKGLKNGYSDALSSGLWPSMDVLPEKEKQTRGQALAPQAVFIAK